MPQKPRSEMAHTDKMSEETDYALHEMKTAIAPMMAILEQKAERVELQEAVSHIEKYIDHKIDEQKKELLQYIEQAAKVLQAEDKVYCTETAECMNHMATKMDMLKAYIKDDLLPKIDAETTLAQDYASALGAKVDGI